MRRRRVSVIMGNMKRYLIILVVALAAVAAWFTFGRNGAGDPAMNYIGNSAEECSRIQVLCIEGFERFDDEKGCGCRPVQ